jgi:DNA gyrase/topoisomerase IV subunit A
MEILPADGEVFLLTSDGKAKRLEQKEFPVQGRYGKGVIAWDLPEKLHLAGVVLDKPNHIATIHLTKGAPKSARLDEVAIRKRAATKGDVVVEVKPGEEVVSVNVAWTVEKFVAEQKTERKKKEGAKTSANGKGKGKSAAKTSSPKGKSAPKKAAPKKAAKPGKKSSQGKSAVKGKKRK